MYITFSKWQKYGDGEWIGGCKAEGVVKEGIAVDIRAPCGRPFCRPDCWWEASSLCMWENYIKRGNIHR